MMNKMETLRELQHWTTKQVLTAQARNQPEKLAVQFIGGSQWSYAELDREARSVAAGLQALGLEPGDRVAVLLKNGPQFVSIWLGAHYAGAVLVGLNTELIGDFLQHAICLCDAKLIVVGAEYLARVQAIKKRVAELEYLQVLDDQADFDNLKQAEDQRLKHYCEYDAEFSDLASLIFTSGTTGPSKAVMMPHAHCYLYGLGTIEHAPLDANSRFYITMPLFHANGLFMQLYACLIRGATAFIRENFSASNWLTEIRELGITHTNLLGVMTEFVARQPSTDRDCEHNLKTIFAAPAAPHLVKLFRERFGVGDLRELYGMSEVNIPLYNPKGAARDGSCGRVYDDFFEVRIANSETDMPLADGQVGEIQVRPKLAAGFMSGYYRMPEKTVEAWRNLWFHTGDAGSRDADGYFYFKDRIRDCIRRRGENISSFEVEKALLAFPGLNECAVIAVPSDIQGGEDEVMAVVHCQGGILDMRALLTHAQLTMPRFAVPRYVRHLATEQFPRTATNKIRKQALREQGITPDTWDAECDGFSIEQVSR